MSGECSFGEGLQTSFGERLRPRRSAGHGSPDDASTVGDCGCRGRAGQETLPNQPSGTRFEPRSGSCSLEAPAPGLFTRQPPLSEMGVCQQGRLKRFSRKRYGSAPWSPPLDATRFRPCHVPEMASGRRRLLQQSGFSGSSCLPCSTYEDWMAFVRGLPDEIQPHSEPGLHPPEAGFGRQQTRLIQ